MLNLKDLRTKTRKEIIDLLEKTSVEVKKVTMGVLDGEEKNLRKPRRLRKDIARIKTVLKEVKNA